MKIEHAFTYKYEKKFKEPVEYGMIKAGQCFKNVINICEAYRNRGSNTSISLVLGLRGWDHGGCTACYHYLVKDDDTGEFTDPQYSRFTFVEIHNWTIDEYRKDCLEFQAEHGYEQSSEFYQWYIDIGFAKVFEKSLMLIKALSNGIKLSDREIKEYCRTGFVYAAPKYGRKVIQYLNVY